MIFFMLGHGSGSTPSIAPGVGTASTLAAAKAAADAAAPNGKQASKADIAQAAAAVLRTSLRHWT